MTFDDMFKQATGIQEGPLPYQRELATSSRLPALLDVPTGLGKTAAAILAWVWRRRFAEDAIRSRTPRRLVYCLSMRVLVEQTYEQALKWLDRLGLLAGEAQWTESNSEGLPTPRARLVTSAPKLPASYVPVPEAEPCNGWASRNGDQGSHPIAVHLLLGGEEISDWVLWPERDAILIGTQDMLLSRALNRGYAAHRARWPWEFGLLNSDCFWVFDEVQLMGSGLATSSQLDCFHSELWRSMIPNQFLWMSATLSADSLQTRDRQDFCCETGTLLSFTDKDRQELEDRQEPQVQSPFHAEKRVEVVEKEPKVTQRDGSGILDRHQPGRLTLVVLNTVRSAKALFLKLEEAINKSSKKGAGEPRPELCLLHSRFRPPDRRGKVSHLFEFLRQQDRATGAVDGHPGFVLVATQVVEAGLDISSVQLWSEIAPWASCIQRLGRLNREGKQPNATAIFWKPKADRKDENAKGAPNEGRIGPYEKRELDTAEKLLRTLVQLQKTETYRCALDQVLASKESRDALGIKPDAVIRPDDIFGLFSTEPDLAGGYTNVSQFVRDQDRNADLHVFWREFLPKEGPSPDEPPPSRDELCPVPYYEFRRFLGDKGVAWEWDFEVARWKPLRKDEVFPGMTLLLARSQGGYSEQLGWTGDPQDKNMKVFEGRGLDWKQPDALELDPTSLSDDWLPLPSHLGDVEAATTELVRSVGLDCTPEGNALVTAARWHDWGKALERYQFAVSEYIKRIVERCDAILNDAEYRDLHDIVRAIRESFGPPGGCNHLWAKWPDIHKAKGDPSLRDDERPKVKMLLSTQFRPGLRHEAASALAAWDGWQKGETGLSALAVYLIASHHGKVRTVLRSMGKRDEAFGLRTGECLPRVDGYFESEASLSFDAKCVGLTGQWLKEDEFVAQSPSWSQMISELLGPALPDDPVPREAIPETEPRWLGPFKLAYLEALLRAADARASRFPRKGGTR